MQTLAKAEKVFTTFHQCLSSVSICIPLVLGISILNGTIGFAQSAPTPDQATSPVPAWLPSVQTKVRAFLGVYSNPIRDGVAITQIVPNSAAAQLGLEPGDIITHIDDFPVGLVNQSEYSLPSEMRRSGAQIKLRFRDVRTGNFVVKDGLDVGGRGKNKGNPNFTPRLGVESQLQEEGAQILAVGQGSAADRARIQVGDLVRMVDGYRIGQIDGNNYFLDNEIRHASSACSLMIERGGAVFPVNVSFGGGTQKTTRIHILMIALTNDRNLGPGLIKDLQLASSVLSVLPQDVVASSRDIRGDECTAKGIIDAVQALDVRDSDAIFCYYAGHGAFDAQRAEPDDKSNGHFLAIPSGDLMRVTLVRTLRAKGARLTVLVTDTCDASGVASPFGFAPAGQVIEPPVQTLLMRYRGFIDINGASSGEYAWTDPGAGGYFSVPFLKTMAISTSWGTVMDLSRSLTQTSYSAFKKGVEVGHYTVDDDIRKYLQEHQGQTPRAFDINVERD